MSNKKIICDICENNLVYTYNGFSQCDNCKIHYDNQINSQISYIIIDDEYLVSFLNTKSNHFIKNENNIVVNIYKYNCCNINVRLDIERDDFDKMSNKERYLILKKVIDNFVFI